MTRKMSYWIWFQIPNSHGISFKSITQRHFSSSLRCSVLFNPNFFSDVCHSSNTLCSPSLLASNKFHSFKLMHQSTRNLSSVNLKKGSAYCKSSWITIHKCNHVDKDPLYLFLNISAWNSYCAHLEDYFTSFHKQKKKRWTDILSLESTGNFQLCE